VGTGQTESAVTGAPDNASNKIEATRNSRKATESLGFMSGDLSMDALDWRASSAPKYIHRDSAKNVITAPCWGAIQILQPLENCAYLAMKPAVISSFCTFSTCSICCFVDSPSAAFRASTSAFSYAL
jgi:hypothetical protein